MPPATRPSLQPGQPTPRCGGRGRHSRRIRRDEWPVFLRPPRTLRAGSFRGLQPRRPPRRFHLDGRDRPRLGARQRRGALPVHWARRSDYLPCVPARRPPRRLGQHRRGSPGLGTPGLEAAASDGRRKSTNPSGSPDAGPNWSLATYPGAIQLAFPRNQALDMARAEDSRRVRPAPLEPPSREFGSTTRWFGPCSRPMSKSTAPCLTRSRCDYQVLDGRVSLPHLAQAGHRAEGDGWYIRRLKSSHRDDRPQKMQPLLACRTRRSSRAISWISEKFPG